MDDELTSIAKLGFYYQDHAPNVENVDLCQFRTIDKKAWRRLVSCNWLSRRNDAVVLGPHGIGKTYVSAAFCLEAMKAGYSIRRTTQCTLEKALSARRHCQRQQVKADTFSNLLIVDDFLPSLPNEPDKEEQLWDFLVDRQSHESVMLITTLPFSRWHLADNPKVLGNLNSILLNSIILEVKPVHCCRPMRKSD